MSELALIFGASTIILGAVLLAIFNPFIKKRIYKRLRVIGAVESLKKASGLSVEEGKRLHISLGSASILSSQNASTLIGLSVLQRLARVSISSDNPPVATSGDGALSILSQEVLKTAHQTGNALDPYSFDSARLSGTTPFAYAVGAIPTINDPIVSSNIVIGHLGPEVAFLSDAAERQKSGFIAASDALEGQAVIYAAAQDPLIGEELFALPAYIQTNPFHQPSLRVQDILRWILIAGLLIGTVVKLFQMLLGSGA